MNTGTFTNTGTISASSEKTFNIAGGDSITITNSGTITGIGRTLCYFFR